MAVAHLDLATAKQPERSRRLSRPDIALYFMWGMFWLLMLAVGVQDYLRNGGKPLWQPILWETSSLAVATFWIVLQRRAGRRYAVHIDRPLVWMVQHSKGGPLVLLKFVPVGFGIGHGVYALVGATYNPEPWPEVWLYESIKLLVFYGLWMGLIFGFDAFAQTQEQRQ